jgi:fructosamine-3-kinase
MAVNTNYSGGFASGAEIADLKTAIQNEELGWGKENTAANTAIFNNNGIRVQWQSGWNMLTGKQQVLRERTDASGNVEALF